MTRGHAYYGLPIIGVVLKLCRGDVVSRRMVKIKYCTKMSKKQRLVHAPERKINDSNWPQAQIRTRRVQYSNDFFFSYFPMLYMPVEKKSGRSWTRTRMRVSVFISSPSLSDTAVLFTAQPVALFVRLDNAARNYENVIRVQLRLSEISSNFSLIVSKKINRPTIWQAETERHH